MLIKASKIVYTLLICLSMALPAVAIDGSSQETSGNERPIRDKWAVVIGVSKFASSKIPELKYPSKDAKDFYDYLVTKGNFAKDHVLLLLDNKASKVDILDAFGDGWLPRRVLQDDLVLVYISSHGSPADVAGENFIIAYDSDPERPYATGIRLQDLSTELTKRTGCDRIVLVLDACHSGAAVSGQKGLTRAASNFNLESITGVGQLVISSSRSSESSWESKRYPNGVFTRQLIDALSDGGPQQPLSEAFNKMRDKVEQEVRFDRVASQTPMILSRWKGSDLSLAAKPSEPRTLLPELPSSGQSAAVANNNTSNQTSSSTNSSSAAQTRPAANNSSSVRTPANSRADKLASTQTPATISSTSPATISSTAPATISSTSPASTGTPGSSKKSDMNLPPVKIMTTDWLRNGGDSTLESGTILITRSQLSKLTDKQLLYLYNEAYARHGRGFLLQDLQRYYDAQSWYKKDPDYHYLPTDPRVLARNGQSDDSLVINEKRTPKQWANMMTIKSEIDSRKH